MDALVAEADAWLDGLEHRAVQVDDEAGGERVARGLKVRGWHVERLVAMRRDGQAPGTQASAPRLAADAVDELSVGWLLEDEVMDDPAAIRSFLADEARAEASVPGELVALGEPGRGFVTVRLAGDAGEIEDAYVAPQARGAGYGTGLLHAAIASARAAEVRDLWIVADADDRPRELYARLGFEAAWTYWDCVLRP